ncbi:DUF2326 domain-containing protein [Bacillus cereus group sp. Bce033]|uniref:DUF2326 domain-containing protein n=1 Tax=Bacillus TaxID=1386 RepID=UPI000771A82B|nr:MULTISPECIES: DUF2326 domain-containing protein [Bacillus]KAB7634104.1 DUF2326 domain-containing protein [Bacillus sp. B4-WWTP-NA-D-NA-NA]KXI55422.1 hypothetical protein ACS45_02015 [Bacillus cereus]MDA1509870.1 DUF2326 domain-containing protein [Bacillus cereus group sp. TH36-2LC]RRA98485.1 DUF2326 domain-containing protein [Bacillus pacificus]
MILKKMFIYSFHENKKLKEYIFNSKGLNIILGEKREDKDETNGVGKTTMVDCLQMLLGKSISPYYEKNVNLIEKNLFIILEIEMKNQDVFLGRAFNSPRYGYILRTGSISFDISEWEKLKITDYKKVVENLVLNNNNNKITFAGLREYIIRDEKTGFNDILLPNRAAIKQYMLLAYLFRMPYETEDKIKELNKVIDKLNNEVKLIESLTGNIGKLKVQEEELIKEIEELNLLIDEAKTLKQYNKNTIEYTNVKKMLNDVQDKIFEYEHICQQYKKNIDNLEGKVNEIKKLDDVEEFYEELLGFFPTEVKQNYQEVRGFYDFMVESRGKYFNNKIENLQSNLKKLYELKNELEIQLEASTKMFNTNELIEDLSILMDDRRGKENDLIEIQLRVKDYNKMNVLNDQINELQQEILRINSMNYDEVISYNKQKGRLQEIFNHLMQVTYNQHGFLDFEYDNRIKNTTLGRLKVSCSIPDEKSHGRLHMKVNMFDLTWFLSRREQNDPIEFLIHDGSYSKPDDHVKGKLLRNIDEKLKDLDSGQYFVTLNKSELLKEDLQFFEQNKCIVAKLERNGDDINRFFGFKF